MGFYERLGVKTVINGVGNGREFGVKQAFIWRTRTCAVARLRSHRPGGDPIWTVLQSRITLGVEEGANEQRTYDPA